MRQEDSKSISTLLNGLVLLMCIGLLSAIVIPAYQSKVNNRKRAEAKQYVSSMNRTQQAKFAENGAFSTSIEALGLCIKTETTDYKYSLRATKQAVFNYGLSQENHLKSYVGGVFLVPAAPNAPKDAMRTSSTILCQADSPGTIEPAEPTYQNGKLICGKGTTEVTK